MTIKYRFSINGHYVNPIYKDDLSKDYALEPQQRFYRTELSGSLKFMKGDFDWIMTQSFETEFVVLLEKSNDGGLTWTNYYTGSFFKTDCSIDLDLSKIEVKLTTKDAYTEVLAGIEKEYDLIKLAPAKTSLTIDKRPLIQLYVPGDSVISCFLSGNSWEQDVVEPTTDTNKLINTYYFALSSTLQKCLITGTGMTPTDVVGEYTGKFVFDPFASAQKWYGRDSKYRFEYNITGGGTPSGLPYKFEIIRSSDSVVLFRRTGYTVTKPPLRNEYTLNAVAGSGASGSVKIYCSSIEVYMRYLLDVTTISSLNTYALPANDIVENNRNYKRAIGYAIDCVTITNSVSETPTQFGTTDDGKYFKAPYSIYGMKFYPVARSTWGLSSLWFAFGTFDWIVEEQGRKPYTMKDSMMISDVIKVLLNTIDPTLTHEGTAEYSQFLYGATNPITFNSFRIMITQKSNILAGEYDQPAQKAPVTLSNIFNMLRDTMKLYWYIDGDKFKIEHISWFKNGGSYLGMPVVSFDLTTLQQKKNQKPWGFLSDKYSYDKMDMAERYEFAWMDDVTEGFAGYPIEVNSKYVQRGKIESINVSTFTSDIDYMLLNSGAISQDGFALFGAIWDSTNLRYKLPYLGRTIEGAELRLQNGLLSFIYLHPNYWVYDLPSENVTINEDGEYLWVRGVERKKKQKVSFPTLDDPNPLQLIKTSLGDGQIEKLSINLQSRMNDIELRYDTE